MSPISVRRLLLEGRETMDEIRCLYLCSLSIFSSSLVLYMCINLLDVSSALQVISIFLIIFFLGCFLYYFSVSVEHAKTKQLYNHFGIPGGVNCNNTFSWKTGRAICFLSLSLTLWIRCLPSQSHYSHWTRGALGLAVTLRPATSSRRRRPERKSMESDDERPDKTTMP